MVKSKKYAIFRRDIFRKGGCHFGWRGSKISRRKKQITKKKAQKEIKQLRKEIEHHNYLYYVLNEPEISDYQYDKLMDRLNQLEASFPDLITPESPTQRVGGQPIKEFRSIEHKPPMLSLDNTYSREEILEFDRRIKKWLGESPSYQISLKVDGVAVSVQYKNSKLLRGVTRGDGHTGDDITENIKTIKSLPLKLLESAPLKELQIRGEVFLSKKAFKKINNERKKRDEPYFANARNAAAGTLKRLDPEEVAGRGLDALFHTIPEPILPGIDSHYQSLIKVQKSGLKIIPHVEICTSIDATMEYIERWKKKRFELDFEVDGLVISVDSFNARAELGTTTKAPRWSIAFKYPAEQAVTTLKKIITQVGRTGRITPVAVLEPVSLSGSTISRATLHNEDEIKRLGIKIDDRVVIEKGGEVIPKVVRAIKEKRNGSEQKFTFPQKCPVCGSKIHRLPDEADYRCLNSSCPAQIKRGIGHFASRGAMDIDGLGTKLIDRLVNKELIEDFADLYKLDVEKLEALDRMGKKSAQNLVNSIQRSKNKTLENLIFGLGIRHVGTHAARLLAQQFGSMDELISAEYDDLAQINGIGPVMAKSIINYFSDPTNIQLIDKLKTIGLAMTADRKAKPNILSGKKFVFTGELKSMPRKDAQELVISLGGKISSSVSRKTDYIVAGKNPGSKYQKGLNLGVEVIDEDKFLKLVRRK